MREESEILEDEADGAMAGGEVDVTGCVEPDIAVDAALAALVALTALAAIDAEQARMVELRFYSGMTAEEIGALTGNSVHRVRHRLRIALAWLHREVNGSGEEA